MDEPTLQPVNNLANLCTQEDLWFKVLAYLMDDLALVALVSREWRQSVERFFSANNNKTSYHALSMCLKDILKQDLTQYHTMLFKDVPIPRIILGDGDRTEFAITDFCAPAHKQYFQTDGFFKTSIQKPDGSYVHDAKKLKHWIYGTTIYEGLTDGSFSYLDRIVIRNVSQNIVSSLAALLLGVQLADLWINHKDLETTKTSELELVTSPLFSELLGRYFIYVNEYLAQFCQDSLLLRLFEQAIHFHKQLPKNVEQINQKLRLETILASIPLADIATFLKRIDGNLALKVRFETLLDDAFKSGCIVVIQKSYPIVAQRMVQNVCQPGYVDTQLKLFSSESITTTKLGSLLNHIELSVEDAHNYVLLATILLDRYEELVDANVLIAIFSSVSKHMTFAQYNEYVHALLKRFPESVDDRVINAIFCALPEHQLSLTDYEELLSPFYEQCGIITYESTHRLLRLIPANVSPQAYIDVINKILTKSSPAQIVNIFKGLIFGKNGFLADRRFKTSLVFSLLSRKYPKVFLSFQSVTESALRVLIVVGNDFTLEECSDLNAWLSVVMQIENQYLAHKYLRVYLQRIINIIDGRQHSELYGPILYLILRYAKGDQELINEGKRLLGLMLAMPNSKGVSYVGMIRNITKALTIQSMPVWVEVALSQMPDNISGKDYTEVFNTLSIRSFVAKHEAKNPLVACLPSDVTHAFEKMPIKGVNLTVRQFVEEKLLKEAVKRRKKSIFMEPLSLLTLIFPFIFIGIVLARISSGSLLDLGTFQVFGIISIVYFMLALSADLVMLIIDYAGWRSHRDENSSKSFLDYQSALFALKTPLSLVFTVLGFSFFALMVSLSIGFFLGNAGCIQLLQPIFDALGEFISKGLLTEMDGTQFWTLAPEVANILGAIFFSIIPLVILEVGRRINLLKVFFSKETKTQHIEDGNYGWNEIKDQKLPQWGSVFADLEAKSDLHIEPGCELVDREVVELSVK